MIFTCEVTRSYVGYSDRGEMIHGHTPKLILLAILILVSMAAAFFTWRANENLEGFNDSEALAILADGGSEYERRLYVMKLFEILLKRKATSDELHKFSAMGSDAEILSTITAMIKPASERVMEHGKEHETRNGVTVVEEDRLPLERPPMIPTPDSPVVHTISGQAQTPTSAPSLAQTRGEKVCVDKEIVQKDIQDIMDHLASFRRSLFRPQT